MSRNMSFSLTTAQMYAGTKHVTRRLGWNFLKPGDIVCAIEKGQGLKKGEHVVKIGPIEILSIVPERIYMITPDDVVLEGFKDMSTEQFIDMFVKANKCSPYDFVKRIQFKHLYQVKP
jgi:hypothetical protein